MNYRIFPLSENALTIDFGNEISIKLNEKVIQLAHLIEQNKFDGYIELVPAYSSLTVFYDCLTIRKNDYQIKSAFSFVKEFVENELINLKNNNKTEPNLIEIPVDYSNKFSLDLEFVAQNAKLSKEEVIKLHTSKTYRVFMIGFLPAFAYMGEIDERIATPRKQTPRTKIEKGSIGIAGKQTGIYPLDSPGGWQIIGKTEIEIFQPDKERISLFKTGDLVKFNDISKLI